ncbi:hypothetical protein PRIPAC_72075 [Pristionchus pacificus]|uniref:Uncharacterized protein n=1 Tax=Pristionchus pacificus TaxID=54126 RepID=A0A2A6C8Q5_PRIPA|nr:hypothetical protein PRIPAC_72075 [Pristionchus pacificus]|eukprot:PDM74486.1 hypothetical protein PRIPAC_41842 [Pristionchus pacificus]
MCLSASRSPILPYPSHLLELIDGRDSHLGILLLRLQLELNVEQSDERLREGSSRDSLHADHVQREALVEDVHRVDAHFRAERGHGTLDEHVAQRRIALDLHRERVEDGGAVVGDGGLALGVHDELVHATRTERRAHTIPPVSLTPAPAGVTA